MAKEAMTVGEARPETVPALVCTAPKTGNKRYIAGRTPGCIVAGLDAAEALNTSRKRNYKRVARKR